MRETTRSRLQRSALPLVAGLWVFGFVTGNWRGNLLRDGDSYWHLATGAWMLEHRAVPHADIFSFSAVGTPWIPHEWLAELVMALAFRAGGWSGLAALIGLAAAATAYGLARHLGRFLGLLPSLVLLGAAGFGILLGLTARPHVLALPLLELWLGTLVIARAEGRGPPWRLLPLMTLWANLHGTFMVGLALAAGLGAEAVLAAGRAERPAALRRWAGFGAAAALAALVTPNGLEGFLLPFRFLGMGEMFQTVSEWRSPDFQQPDALELILLGGMLFGFWRGLRLPPLRLIMLLGLVHAALQHVRNEVIIGLIAALLVAEPLARQMRTRAFRPAGGPATLGFELAIGAPAALALALLLALNPISRGDDRVTPGAALAQVPPALQAQPVLNEYSFGGYLIFRGLKPLIDGRTDMYGGAFLRTYVAAARAESGPLQDLLSRYAIAWTLLPPDSPVVAVLDASPGWRRLYADPVAVVHVRARPDG